MGSQVDFAKGAFSDQAADGVVANRFEFAAGEFAAEEEERLGGGGCDKVARWWEKEKEKKGRRTREVPGMNRPARQTRTMRFSM